MVAYLLRLAGGESGICARGTESTAGPLFLRIDFLLLVPTSLLSVSSTIVVLVRISLLIRSVVGGVIVGGRGKSSESRRNLRLLHVLRLSVAWEVVELVWLRDGRAKGIVRLLGLTRRLRLDVGLTIAAKLAVRLSSLTSNGRRLLLRLLVHRGQTWGRLRGRDRFLGLRLAGSSRLAGSRGKRSPRLLGGGMLRGLRTRLGLLTVFIYVKCGIAVQAKAAKLHSCAVHGVVTRHDNRLLLIQNLPLIARAAALGSSGLLCRRSESPDNGTGCLCALRSSQRRRNADDAATSNGARSSAGRGRFCDIGQVFDILLRELILGWGKLCRRQFRNFRSDNRRLCGCSGRLYSRRFISNRRYREFFSLDCFLNFLRRLRFGGGYRSGGFWGRGGNNGLWRRRRRLRLRKHLGPGLLRGLLWSSGLLHGLRRGDRLGLGIICSRVTCIRRRTSVPCIVCIRRCGSGVPSRRLGRGDRNAGTRARAVRRMRSAATTPKATSATFSSTSAATAGALKTASAACGGRCRVCVRADCRGILHLGARAVVLLDFGELRNLSYKRSGVSWAPWRGLGGLVEATF